MLPHSFEEGRLLLMRCLKVRDARTYAHCINVGTYCHLFGVSLGLVEQACQQLHLAGLLHDIGKIGVADAVLYKPSRLTSEEFGEVQRHAALATEVLQPLPLPPEVRSAIYHHHERWDGQGYPGKLAGTRIPLFARIIALCDTWDAMVRDRPYQLRRTPQEASDEILRNKGTQFDADLADHFLTRTLSLVQSGALPVLSG